MNKSISEKETKRAIEQRAFDKDKKRAEALMTAYAEFKKDKDELEAKINADIAAVKDRYKDELSKIMVPMEEAAKSLIEIGERNKKWFEKNRLTLEHGYLLRSFKSIPKLLGELYDQARFVKKFPALVTVDFNVKQLKETLLNSKSRQKVLDYGVDITEIDTIQIKVTDKLDAKAEE